MPDPLSIDLRQRILAVCEAKEGSQRHPAERFKVGLSFIRDLMSHYRETRTVYGFANFSGVLIGHFSIHPSSITLLAIGAGIAWYTAYKDIQLSAIATSEEPLGFLSEGKICLSNYDKS